VENEINVAHYVSELLFQHDCVVVPGFGAFVSTYASAKVHPAQHTFTPPSKQIVFNKHLQQNDGLLAQTIASEFPCPFEVSMKGITRFVENLNEQLKAGKKVELHNLGTLSFDPEKNISFEAFTEINYLIDSFGLGSFQSMPILREAGKEKEIIERKPVVREDRSVAEELKVAKPVRRRSRTALITSAIAVPVLAAAFWFTTQNVNGIAGFGIFGKAEPSKYHAVKWFSKIKDNAESSELKADSSGIAEISLADNAPAIIVDIHKAVPDSTRVAVTGAVQGDRMNAPTTEKRYYVIGGCFGVPQNAMNFLASLKAKGYNPAVIDHVRSKLIHIALASFSSQQEAESFLSAINGNVQGAWILKK
jgi:hypothetical protein